jgi:hypothetical protein
VGWLRVHWDASPYDLPLSIRHQAKRGQGARSVVFADLCCMGHGGRLHCLPSASPTGAVCPQIRSNTLYHCLPQAKKRPRRPICTNLPIFTLHMTTMLLISSHYYPKIGTKTFLIAPRTNATLKCCSRILKRRFIIAFSSSSTITHFSGLRQWIEMSSTSEVYSTVLQLTDMPSPLPLSIRVR